MQKIYLLLRNNKQTGPYSLDELVAAKLKSYDLVWVEGRSAGWRYPSEIDALKPFLPSEMVTQEVQLKPAGHIEKMPETTAQQVASPIGATLKSSAKHVFVSLPSGIKQREVPVEATVQENISPNAEVKNIHSYTEVKNNYSQPLEEPLSHTKYSASLHEVEPVPQTKYSRSLEEVEEDYTKWMFTKKKKSALVSRQTLVFSVAGLILFAALYIGISYFTNNKSNVKTSETSKSETAKMIPSTTTNNVTTEVATKQQVQTIQQQDNIASKVPDIKASIVQKHAGSIPPTSTVAIVNRKSNSSHAGKSLKQHQLAIKKEKQKETMARILPKQNPVFSEQPSITEKHEPVSEAKTKKKGFGAFLNGVFGKLKKKNQDAPVAENHPTVQAMPSETRANGERRTTRRDDNQQADNETTEQQDYTPLPSLIELQGSERNNSWQLGVYDLKLTLINRNNVSVKSADVNILYFDENNRLLETKTVYFNTVAPRGHSTIRVPDQKWADHTDYKLVALK